MRIKRRVHSTGSVARSDGNDTDCGATGDLDKLLISDDPSKVTCRRCLKIIAAQQPLKGSS